jgi:hypothetical protein
MKKLTRASFEKQNQVNNNAAKKGSIVGFVDTRDNEHYTNQAICPWTDELWCSVNTDRHFCFLKNPKTAPLLNNFSAAFLFHAQPGGS